MVLASFRGFTKRQWVTLFVFAVADFCSAICVSLQAPFYPKEAQDKGATATEYGLVFGIFELMVFIVSPLLGKNLGRFGAKRVFNVGILTTGTCCIIFGLLDKIQDGKAFIALSFVVRAVEAIGNSGFLTASFSIIAKEFPETVATMFACLETFFGIGLIVGPTVGGALYQWGGYTLPFAALGSLLIAAAVMTHFVLPSKYDEAGNGSDSANGKGMIDLLKIPSISVAAYSILCASITIGYIQATLEPHLRQFHLTPLTMGFMFVVNGGSYAIFAPFWGYLCDKKWPPVLVTCIGTLFITLSFLLIGPAPFIPMDPNFNVIIAMLVVHGIGFAAELVAGFSCAHREAIANGFPDNLGTYALVSGLWTATFALGAFVGPSVAGLLVDYFEFRYATLFVIATQITVFFMTFFMVTRHYRKKARMEAYEGIEALGVTDCGYDSFTDGTPTPDSGRYTDHGAIDVADRLERVEALRASHTKPIRRRRISNLGVPNARSSYGETRFSPLDPSPVSLLGGYMGISVPTTMNNIFEEPEFALSASPRPHSSNERQALLEPRTRTKPSDPRIVVTAIVEEDSSRRSKHPSGSIL